MITVMQLLEKKGKHLWTISSQETAYKALEIMAEKNIGALMVVDDGKLKGIFSERDYARKVILKGKSSQKTIIAEVMTPELCCIGPERTLEECMALMGDMDIRHVPVFNSNKLLGIVSMRDVVNEIISEQKIALSDLGDYICGKGYGKLY
jgi:CBS domain-containing protein